MQILDPLLTFRQLLYLRTYESDVQEIRSNPVVLAGAASAVALLKQCSVDRGPGPADNKRIRRLGDRPQKWIGSDEI
jgi:hypothetical protein